MSEIIGQSKPRLSVMVPNYNYAQYIGETIGSVLAQPEPDIEVVISDNASTDTSVEVVRGFSDPRVRYQVNPWNVGFAGNLEKVAAMARGHRMLMLSSDDRMRPGAVGIYRRLENALGSRADRAIWGSSATVIDSNGKHVGPKEPDPKVWRDAVVDKDLSDKVGHQVRAISAEALLNRSLSLMRNVLPFATACYPRALHDAVGGYAGGRLVNPDKWFLWKLLSVTDMVYTVDHPLFDYRVHSSNQNSLQRQSGALKHLIDQYVATFDLPEPVLKKAKAQRSLLANAYIEQDIALRGLALLAEGERVLAKRYLTFGMAAYPEVASQNKKIRMLKILLMMGPLGTPVARLGRQKYQEKWKAQQMAVPTGKTLE